MTPSDDRSSGESPWQSCEMVCLICGRAWVATFPIEAARLECPDCGYRNAVPCPANPDDDAPEDA
jgi:DNA-directed RNA polymerase subunit RPC12/RpoP